MKTLLFQPADNLSGMGRETYAKKVCILLWGPHFLQFTSAQGAAGLRGAHRLSNAPSIGTSTPTAGGAARHATERSDGLEKLLFHRRVVPSGATLTPSGCVFHPHGRHRTLSLSWTKTENWEEWMGRFKTSVQGRIPWQGLARLPMREKRLRLQRQCFTNIPAPQLCLTLWRTRMHGIPARGLQFTTQESLHLLEV